MCLVVEVTAYKALCIHLHIRCALYECTHAWADKRQCIQYLSSKSAKTRPAPQGLARELGRPEEATSVPQRSLHPPPLALISLKDTRRLNTHVFKATVYVCVPASDFGSACLRRGVGTQSFLVWGARTQRCFPSPSRLTLLHYTEPLSIQSSPLLELWGRQSRSPLWSGQITATILWVCACAHLFACVCYVSEYASACALVWWCVGVWLCFCVVFFVNIAYFSVCTLICVCEGQNIRGCIYVCIYEY